MSELLTPGDRVKYVGRNSFHDKSAMGHKGTFTGYTETGCVKVSWDDTSTNGPGSGAKYADNAEKITAEKPEIIRKDEGVAALETLVSIFRPLCRHERKAAIAYLTARFTL